MTAAARRATAIVVAAGVLALAGACSTAQPSASAGPGDTGSDVATTSTTSDGGVDQTPPLSTFGLAFHDNELWVADFYGGQVLGVDASSGRIMRRLKAEDDVSDEVEDVAVAPDGSVFWVGFNDGAVGRMSPANVGVTIARVPEGASAIAFSPDGLTLYVGCAVISNGLYRVDPSGQKPKETISSSLKNVNSFATASDGSIYGPQYGTGTSGKLVHIDPGTGTSTVVATGLDSPIAAAVDPSGTKAYVLSLPPGSRPALHEVDLRSGAVTPMPSPRTALADDLTVAPDGRIFVSSYNEATISVIATDGTVSTLSIGHRA
jgi:streptogramin lyase